MSFPPFKWMKMLALLTALAVQSLPTMFAAEQPVSGTPTAQPAEAIPEEHLATTQPASGEPEGESGEVDSAHENLPFHEWDRLTGNWFGVRDAAEEKGITFEAYYTIDFLSNARGGLSTDHGDTYFGLFDASLSLDTEALGLWKGGTFYFNMQDFRGRTPSERLTGDFFYVNGNDAPERFQLSEFWWEQSFFDGLIRTKLGKQDPTADFTGNLYGAEFLNGGTFYISNMPIPVYPDPAMGAALFVEPVDWFTVGAGIYDADGIGNESGFNTAFHDEDTSFTIVELALKPRWKWGEHELPGVYRVGGWFHSGLWDVYFNDLDGRLEPRAHRGNSGVYCSLDQFLFKENPSQPDDEQGLGTYFQFGWAPSSYNEVSQVYGFGLQYVGALPTRDSDIVGLGFVHASMSGEVQSLEHRYAESVIEWYYKIQVTNSISIKPDIQYIFDPGGNGQDALVVGARLEVSF